jgi:hypothetical protein
MGAVNLFNILAYWRFVQVGLPGTTLTIMDFEEYFPDTTVNVYSPRGLE